jgi:RNA polymerase sigma factor (sigma-70 family)
MTENPKPAIEQSSPPAPEKNSQRENDPMSQSDRQKSKQEKEFDAAFCELIKLPAVRNRIAWLLAKHRIKHQWEVNDITSEVYIRAIKSIQAGKPILNLYSWFRSTAQNVVSERWRTNNRRAKIEDRLKIEWVEADIISDTSDDRVDRLVSRLEQLNPTDRTILLLQAQGMSLARIADQLVQAGDFQPLPNLVGTITKRASRARRTLREKIPQMQPVLSH